MVPALLKAALLWLLLLVLAVGNGMLRKAVLVPNLGSAGLPASGITLALAILAVALLAAPWFGPGTHGRWWAIGAFWLALTLGFEFGFGLAAGMTWQEILGAYDPRSGNLWLLVVAMTLVAPPLAARLRGLHPGAGAAEAIAR